MDNAGNAGGASVDKSEAADEGGEGGKGGGGHAPGGGGEEVGGAVRFMVDSMLGKSVKWLRCLGVDTVMWEGARHPHELLSLAASEGRVVLTRDRKLLAKPGRNFFFCCFVSFLGGLL